MPSRAGRSLAFAALCLLGCNLRAPRVTENSCNHDPDCPKGQVCFATQCRSPASALSAVLIEVTPPTGSPYAPVQQSLDLRASAVIKLDLPGPKRFDGTLVQDGDGAAPPSAVAGAALEFRDADPIIPGRAFSVTVQSDPSGTFTARLPPSVNTLRITPPAPLPVLSLSLGEGDSKGVILHLPARSQLASVAGTLTLSGAALAFARVLPVDPAGMPLGPAAITDAGGRFTLLLPPPPVQYLLRIGDAPDAATQAPARGPLPAFADDAFGVRTATSVSNTVVIDLDALPPPATLSGRVVDQSGAGVAQARVSAASLTSPRWVLSRSAQTAADGSFTLPLREGRYVLEALPAVDPDQPALSGEHEVTVAAAGSPLVVTCPPKLHASGRVQRSGGTSLSAGAQVIATRLPDRLVGGRSATATATDANGRFTLIGDPGTYRMQIIPTSQSGEPEGLAFLPVEPSLASTGDLQLDPIQLSPPLVVAGAIRGAGGPPLAVTSVEVFAVNASSESAIKLGGTVTNTLGQFSLVLPDVSHPAAAR